MSRSHPSTPRGRRVAGAAIALLLAVLFVPSARLAQSQQRDKEYTEISGTGQTLFKVAVPPVLTAAGSTEPARTMTRVMTRDLTLSGMFKVLDARSFLANLEREGVGVDAQAWANVGAQAVIKAQARVSGGQLSVDFYLYDVTKGAKPILARNYRGSVGQARLLAHRFGDEVFKHFTGERGFFTTKIAFVIGNPRRKLSHVYVMDYDGYGASRISKTGDLNLLPAWSPSGAVAYTSYLWRNPDLFLYRGGRAERISKWTGQNTGAAFSPNGRTIALTLTKDGNAEIYLIDLSGRVLRRLTHNAAIDTSPSWSPDGGQIAFVSDRGGSPQIYVMSAGGGGARRLTFQGSYNQEPSWCPRKDNPVVAFTGRDGRSSYDIFTVNVRSGEVKRLTQGQGSNRSPTWAPNGRVLAFSSSRGGIWLMTADGFNQQKLGAVGASPSWSK